MVEPTKIPMTTHNRRPKIEVGFDSSEFTNVASYTDIVWTVVCVCVCVCVCVKERDREREKGFWGVFVNLKLKRE